MVCVSIQEWLKRPPGLPDALHEAFVALDLPQDADTAIEDPQLWLCSAAHHELVFSSSVDHRRASTFAATPSAKKLLTTSSLNCVLYFFMKPLKFVQLLGVSSVLRWLFSLRGWRHEEVERVITSNK